MSATEGLGARDAKYPAAPGRLGVLGITKNCPANTAPQLSEKQGKMRTCITIPRIMLPKLCYVDLYPKDFYITQALYFLSNKIKIGRLSTWLRKEQHTKTCPRPRVKMTKLGRVGKKGVGY